MISNYLKVIFRNLFSDGLFTAVIVFGLAVGIAVCLIIGQYAYFEFSFDKHYKDNERIYYTYIHWLESDGEYDELCHPAVGPLIKISIPDAESVVRIAPIGTGNRQDEWVLSREKEGQVVEFGRIDHMYRADPEVFDFFSIPMIEGDPKTALVNPGNGVITKSVADRFFPGESALNKTLKVSVFDFTVTGVIEDPAPNSTLRYNVFFPFYIGFDKSVDSNWIWPEFRTFVKLNSGTDYHAVEEKTNQAASVQLSKLKKTYNVDESIRLYPFNEFHFYKPYRSSGVSTVKFTGDKRIVAFFVAIAVLILIVCWANYINLTIARSLVRAKEVGLRKINGASRPNLILQFLLEFFTLNLISMFIAFTITQIVFTSFASSIGSDAEWVLWKYPLFWLIVLCFLFISTLISGIYPAFVMSGYNPVRVLKGKFSRSKGGTLLRKVLVFVQFGLASILMMSIYVITRQLNYLQTKDLGMSPEQVLIIRLENLPMDIRNDRARAYEIWKSKIERMTGVSFFSASGFYPGDKTLRYGFYTKGNSTTSLRMMRSVTSPGYLHTMGIKLLYGRDFKDIPADTTSIIISETAAREFGYEDPEKALGEKLTFTTFDYGYEIVGIVKDFTPSRKFSSSGLIFHHLGHWKSTPGYFMVKLSTKDLSTTMDTLEKQWAELFNCPFDYFFLDSYFDTFYKEERQFAGVFGFFSIVGVAITCMGLFALSMNNTASRTKEIGIRKSLGGSSSTIMCMLSKEYLSLVVTAGVVCIPIGVWLLTDWLRSYPNRITFGVDFILIPLIIIVFIAQLTVGYQTYRASHMNPVNALKVD
jgi:putative ABC transport system permease protein